MTVFYMKCNPGGNRLNYYYTFFFVQVQYKTQFSLNNSFLCFCQGNIKEKTSFILKLVLLAAKFFGQPFIHTNTCEVFTFSELQRWKPGYTFVIPLKKRQETNFNLAILIFCLSLLIIIFNESFYSLYKQIFITRNVLAWQAWMMALIS